MIDIRLVRTQPEMVRELCRRRGVDVDVDRLIDLDAQLRRLTGEADSLPETHSNTNLLDFQTRRLGIRCKNRETFLPHTISATMITDRAALAILENNQTASGSVVVPEALRPYLGGRDRIAPDQDAGWAR